MNESLDDVRQKLREDCDLIRDLYAAGWTSPSRLAEALQCSRERVVHLLRKLGLTHKMARHFDETTLSEELRMRLRFRNGNRAQAQKR
jgi:hypothetical protein